MIAAKKLILRSSDIDLLPFLLPMKKILLLLIAVSFFKPSSSLASHVLGGEITWHCLPNGKYVFYAKVYRDCTGINYPFDTKSLEIVGNPLPTLSIGGTPISSIPLKPDSAQWIQKNFGDISPQPSNPNCSGQIIRCNVGDEGAIQEFPFISDTIQLFGAPSSVGWKFFISQPCCRPNITNLAATGTMILRATLFAGPNNVAPGICHESSPEFIASPKYLFCRGVALTNQFGAADRDLDSLVYSWDRTYNTPAVAPQPVPYAQGYNYNNPTPDSTFHPRNNASSLNAKNGIVKFDVFSGSPNTRDYLVSMKVDAYRRGVIVSSVIRELPIVLRDCPTLPNNRPNTSPAVSFANNKSEYTLTVRAGEQVQVPILANDLDSNGNLAQRLVMKTNGATYSNDFSSTSNCDNPPCAVFLNNVPVFNSTSGDYEFADSGSVATTFSWQTACNHAGSDGETVTYRFYFNVQDDHCPVNLSEDACLIVNVFPREPNGPREICGERSSTDLDLNWNPNGTDSANFISWRVYKKSLGMSSFQLLDTIASYSTLSYTDTSFDTLLTAEYKVAAFTNLCGNPRQGRFSNTFITTNLQAIVVDQFERTLSTSTPGQYQWYNCITKSIIPGETSFSYTPQDSGTYAVILYRGDCADTSSCMFVYGVGLDENSLESELTIYPNPARGFFFLGNANSSSLNLRIYGLDGSLLKEENIIGSQNKIDLPNSAGIYLIQLTDESGRQTSWKVLNE